MKTIDCQGKTLETFRAETRRIMALYDPSMLPGDARATIGRLYHSARRWSWSLRFEPAGVSGSLTLTDGSRWDVAGQLTWEER